MIPGCDDRCILPIVHIVIILSGILHMIIPVYIVAFWVFTAIVFSCDIFKTMVHIVFIIIIIYFIAFVDN